jgi:hypothetical protein
MVQEIAMLSEIYFLKLEAAKRAAEEAARAESARYVPLAPSIVPGKTIAGASQPNTESPQR